jgi:sterol desaturase/sphingolipid hydroxylase (fatty acid hydroxylase superfamily)
VGYGHEGTEYGCNFGVLVPWWDMIFRTASWNAIVEPTGIRDQLPVPHGAGRSYGDGLIAQQWREFERIVKRLRGQRKHASGAVE